MRSLYIATVLLILYLPHCVLAMDPKLEACRALFLELGFNPDADTSFYRFSQVYLGQKGKALGYHALDGSTKQGFVLEHGTDPDKNLVIESDPGTAKVRPSSPEKQRAAAEQAGAGSALVKNPPGFKKNPSEWLKYFGPWFGGKSPREAMVGDFQYMSDNGLDPAATMKRIGERMDLFAEKLEKAGARSSKISLGEYLVEDVDHSKGLQTSPYGDFVWAGEIKVTHRKTGAVVILNRGTAQMAAKHSVLEKGEQNPYAVSVEVFLREFLGPLE